MRIPVHGRVKKPRIYILSVDRMFETLLQVMSNDGLKLLYVQLHRHLSTQFNNTGGEANLKKCMLLCLIQTSVILAIIKASKGHYFERFCFGGHLKRSRCGRL